jgi:hypothetical protein
MQEELDFFGIELLYRIISGGLVGAVTVTVVTPIMNFTNHILKSSATSSTNGFTMQRAFDGVLAYNSSVVPMTAVSLTLNSMLTVLTDKKAHHAIFNLKIINATLSGMVAGIIGSIPEAVAQAQQLNTPKLRASQLIKEVINNNGFFALSRGMPAMMIRQGIFTAGFVGLMPIFAQEIRKVIGNNLVADLFSACVCGLIVGPLTAPWNKLRFEKQKDFHIQGSAPSYFEIIKQSGSKKLMSGWQPRTLMSVCSMFLLHKGREIFDECNFNLATRSKK